ncbi:MAG: germination protein [Paenibacillus sp.]|jgi:spore germination protein KA|nr:germination protein [Paenibacillus sp.]
MIKLSLHLDENIEAITDYLGSCDDLFIRRMEIDRIPAAVIFIYTLVDKAVVDEFVIQELFEQRRGTYSERHLDTNGQSIESAAGVQKSVCSIEETANFLLQGFCVLMMEGHTNATAASAGGGQRRSVMDPANESVVRGSRESFNESLLTNIGLVRRRLATPRLRILRINIGQLSNTPVVLMYIEDLAKPEIVHEVERRIKRIEIDGILESQYIEEMIEERKGYTPFPTIFNTERPDRIAAGLMEGRVAILMEGTPIGLIAPATLSLFLYSNEDYYQRYDIATFLKLLRTVTFLISFTLPGFYVALLTFHQEMIPTPLLIALTGQREGVPFGIAIEVFLMEITFEILREAGIRLPKTIGSAVSIVGGLVLGQAAVEAGLVAPGTVIAVSATAIASFCTPSFNIAITARLIRFALIMLAAFLGAFGLFFGMIFVFIHLNTLRSFGVPYMTPIVPFHGKSWMDLFIRAPWWSMRQRPVEIAQDTERMPPSSGKNGKQR